MCHTIAHYINFVDELTIYMGRLVTYCGEIVVYTYRPS